MVRIRLFGEDPIDSLEQFLAFFRRLDEIPIEGFADGDVCKHAGRIAVEMQERFRSSIKDAELLLVQSLSPPDLLKQIR